MRGKQERLEETSRVSAAYFPQSENSSSNVRGMGSAALRLYVSLSWV
jgi:hypothetical protein